MKISEVANRAGVLPTTIRFYESTGLLPAPHRINRQRVYGPEVLDQLAIIRFGLKTGFSLREVKLLFQEFKSRAKRRSAAQRKLKELETLRERVQLMEKFLRQIHLCRCGTIQKVANRLAETGILANESSGLKTRVIPALQEIKR